MRMLFERHLAAALPFCVMTNSGIAEAAKAEELTNMLDVPISSRPGAAPLYFKHLSACY
jgi:hypothetical protein